MNYSWKNSSEEFFLLWPERVKSCYWSFWGTCRVNWPEKCVSVRMICYLVDGRPHPTVLLWESLSPNSSWPPPHPQPCHTHTHIYNTSHQTGHLQHCPGLFLVSQNDYDQLYLKCALGSCRQILKWLSLMFQLDHISTFPLLVESSSLGIDGGSKGRLTDNKFKKGNEQDSSYGQGRDHNWKALWH